MPGTAAAPDALIAANAPPGSQPSHPPPSSTSPKSPTLTGIITLIVAVAVGVPTYLWTRGPHGHRATTAELIGHWVHQESGVTIEIILRGDGSYQRLPKNLDMTSAGIWEAGTWRIDHDGALIFTPIGGSYYPYLNGENLTLEDQTGRGKLRFTRNP